MTTTPTSTTTPPAEPAGQHPDRAPSRLGRWHAATDLALTATALVFLVAYAVQVLARPHGMAGKLVDLTMALTWLLFVVDYLVRLSIAEVRGRWFLTHPLDLAMVVLPMLPAG